MAAPSGESQSRKVAGCGAGQSVIDGRWEGATLSIRDEHRSVDPSSGFFEPPSVISSLLLNMMASYVFLSSPARYLCYEPELVYRYAYMDKDENEPPNPRGVISRKHTMLINLKGESDEEVSHDISEVRVTPIH